MPRHARNSTAGSYYTYHEKKKDSIQSGYGSKEVRLGKDSIREFDCCCLSLQPCIDPVVTPDGFLYEREAILKYIIKQKKDYAKQLKEYEKQKQDLHNTNIESEKNKTDEIIKTFLQRNSTSTTKQQADEESISNMSNGLDKQLPSFWVSTLTPQATPTLVKKPDGVVKCPMSGRPLKYKDLIQVKFTLINDGKDSSLITKQARYVCAVTNDVLGNSVPCAVLRPSGSVVTMDCVERIIKKDMIDPISSAKLADSDIIVLQRGATSFSSVGLTLKAVKGGAVMSA